MDNYRAGIVAATIANVNRGKNTKGFQPSDFFPDKRERKRGSVKEIAAKLKAWATGFKGK